MIAYAAGGAMDTVIEGQTGTFFHEQTSEVLAAAVRAFDPDQVDPQTCHNNAERFAAEVFKRNLNSFIQTVLSGRRADSL